MRLKIKHDFEVLRKSLCGENYIVLWYVNYLLQLGFHSVAVVGKLVQK